jgi:putative endonuclease
MYYVYILRSMQDGRFYIGSTQDVTARLARPNSGGSRYTKNKGPWELLYTEQFNSRALAMQREKRIKGWKNKKCIEQLIASACPEGCTD